MAANSYIYGKVFNIRTIGFITSAATAIQGWYQYGSVATTASRAIIVDRESHTGLIGCRATSGGTMAIGGLAIYAPKGLSCTVCSAGTVVTAYLR